LKKTKKKRRATGIGTPFGNLARRFVCVRPGQRKCRIKGGHLSAQYWGDKIRAEKGSNSLPFNQKGGKKTPRGSAAVAANVKSGGGQPGKGGALKMTEALGGDSVTKSIKEDLRFTVSLPQCSGKILSGTGPMEVGAKMGGGVVKVKTLNRRLQFVSK